MAALSGLKSQLVGHLEGLAKCQDDLIGQVLSTRLEANRCDVRMRDVTFLNTQLKY